MRDVRMAVVLVAAFALAAFAPRVPVALASVDPQISSAESSIVVVAHGQAAAVARFAAGAGARDVRALDALDLLTARLDGRATRALAANVAVREIASDADVVAADSGTRGDRVPVRGPKRTYAAEGANAPRTMSAASGPVTVAVVDSGVADQPELAGKILTRVDFVNDGATSFDPGGHGTFMAGLIAGTSTGVYPKAQIVALRVLNEAGVGKVHNVLAAFDWLLRHRAEYQVRVVNLSFGAPQRVSYHRDVLAAAAESLWFAGMVVVAAGGNDGPRLGTIDTPGGDPFVVTVGSLDQKGSAPAMDDRESKWSSRGPTLDGFTKPDLLAPGENLVSLRVPGSFLDRMYPDHMLSDSPTYTRMSGTSVSTAIASGVAAFVLGVYPTYSPTQVKTALVETARRVRGSSTGAVDAGRAIARTVHPHSRLANAGLRPSLLLLLVVAGQLGATNVTWENVTWENVSWQNVTWENVSWESVTWESVTWEAVTWEGVAR